MHESLDHLFVCTSLTSFIFFSIFRIKLIAHYTLFEPVKNDFDHLSLIDYFG